MTPARWLRHCDLKKGKGGPVLETSVGHWSWSRSSAISPQASEAGGRLPILSVRLAVTSPDAERHRSLAGTKLYCLVTEAHVCKQLAQGCTRQRGGRDSNTRPHDRKSGALTTRYDKQSHSRRTAVESKSNRSCKHRLSHGCSVDHISRLVR